LAAMMEGGPKRAVPEQPKRPDGPPRPDAPKRIHAARKKSDQLPAPVAKVFERRSGYANYWFNRDHQRRVWNSYLARGDFAGVGWNWTIRGRNKADGDVEIELAEEHGSIVMPAGRSEAQFTLSLAESLSPPRSGGLLAALHLWQRLVLVGPRRFGEVWYFGTLPWPDDGRLAACLVGIQGGVETRFYFDPTEGDLVGIEMQAAEDQDPCEIYLSDFRPVDGRRLPHRWVIRHGDKQFADLRITDYELRSATARPAAGSKDEAND